MDKIKGLNIEQWIEKIIALQKQVDKLEKDFKDKEKFIKKVKEKL